MSHPELVDSVSVSASYYFTDWNAVPEPLNEAAHRITKRSDGSVVLAFGRSTVERSDAEARQDEFLKAESHMFRTLRAFGITREQLANYGGQLHLRVTLSPVSGQAGVVLTQDLLLRWETLGADIYIDAFPS